MKSTEKKHPVKSLLLLFFCIAIAIAAGFLITELYVPVSASGGGSGEEAVRVEIPSGASARRIASLLKAGGLIRSERIFYIVSRFPFPYGRASSYSLKSGVYNVERGATVKEILELLESGRQAYITAVFPEGLTLSKISETLERLGVCSSQDFLAASRDISLLSEYGIPAASFEGFLFPDTYFFTPLMEGKDVVRMMADNFLRKADEIEQFKGKSIAQFYETVVLASIVEREYRAEAEAPLIASVFVNRLNENIGLYSCATIEYIITEIQGREHPDVITYDDLKIDSPYNTYKWAGLPPGPISNPGLVALRAAANPPKTSYYYFTLTDEARGTHTFTRSLSSHAHAGSVFKTKKAAGSR